MTEVEPGWEDYAGHVAAYRAARAALTLPLPDGVTLPDSPGPEPEPGNTLYETGSGEVEAMFAWLHFVERAAVDAHERGDREEAARWVRVAGRFVETDVYARLSNHGRPVTWYDHVIVPALGGDFTNITADADANAPYTDERL